MKLINIITLIVSLIALVLGIFSFTNQTKTVFIKTGEVMQGYVGLKEANAIYERKMSQSKGLLDTIVMEHQKKVAEYEGKMNKLSPAQREISERDLLNDAEKIKRFNAASEEGLAEENEQLLTGVLNQINAFAEIYAREKGYDLVIGTTSSGNLMYGNSRLDVTEDFIKRLNNYYKKGH